MVRKQPGVDIALLDANIKRRMILWPRGSAKTTFSRVEQMQWMLNYPNVRICFLSGGEAVSMPQLEALKRHFSHPSDNMVKYFPEYVMESKWNKKTSQWEDVLVKDWGTQHHFTVPCRTNFGLPEATFTLATEEAISSGTHFDIIFVDDLQNNANSRTTAALDKTHKSYLDILPLLMPQGYLMVTGTRYANGDVYQKIQTVASKESKWLFAVRDCYSTMCTRCGHPDVFHDRNVDAVNPPGLIPGYECAGFISNGVQGCLCPTIICKDGSQYGYTLDFLAMQKAESLSFFACQYLNRPELIRGAQVFTEELIKTYTILTEAQFETQFPRNSVELFIGADLAYSGPELGDLRDESVMLIFVKYCGQIAIRNAAFGQWNASARVDMIVNLLHKLRPRTMFIEANINHESTQLLVEAACRAAGVHQIPIVWVEPNRAKGAKSLRIENSEQVMKTGRLWLYKDMPGYDKLVKQMLDFPNCIHDDMIDCLGMCVESATKNLQLLAQMPPEMARLQKPNWLQQLSQPREPEYGPDQNDGSRMCGMD
jgi:LmbE family N-acetylglucosaminyl deacetylase